MKRTLLFIALLSATMAYCATTKTEILLKGDFSILGTLVSSTDSTVTILQDVIKKEKTYTPKDVKQVLFPDGTTWVVQWNKFVDYKIYLAQQDSIKQAKAKAKAVAEKQRMGDPNLAVANAMKTTGSICMGVGVPSLFVGTILCICANKGPSDEEVKQALGSPQAVEKLEKKYARMSTSGAILAGAGCALTVAGIPLYVHGKKIMDVNLQMSDNGAGVAVKF